ncbi:LuxR C-terminal-related transcriptional regulator [Pseudonocardia alni]|uniref:LuxR C-terminal-related transcriptional regulator n=1 Tax=Pseudonocardia alni TaxID=33907 RepID=UPI00332FA00B
MAAHHTVAARTGADLRRSVLVVDVEQVWRELLSRAIGRLAGVECAGTAGSVERAVVLAETAPPSVLLVDPDFPGVPAGAVLRRLVTAAPDAALVVLVDADAADLDGVPAFAVVSKRSPLDEVLGAVTAAPARVAAPGPALTRRELEVLELLERGRSATVIAAHLVMSPATCRSHLAALRRKLGAHSLLEVVVRAQHLGLAGRPGRDG